MKFARGHVGDPQLCSSPIAELDAKRLAGAELACDRGACRYHLPSDDAHHCALLWADRGGMDLESIGAAIGCTKQRAQQLVVGATERASVRGVFSLGRFARARGFPESEVDGVGSEAL